MKGRSRTHSIWSPGSLCEQEMKSVVEKADSSQPALHASHPPESRWKWEGPGEKDPQSKAPTIGPGGEKQFVVSS